MVAFDYLPTFVGIPLIFIISTSWWVTILPTPSMNKQYMKIGNKFLDDFDEPVLLTEEIVRTVSEYY